MADTPKSLTSYNLQKLSLNPPTEDNQFTSYSPSKFSNLKKISRRLRNLATDDISPLNINKIKLRHEGEDGSKTVNTKLNGPVTFKIYLEEFNKVNSEPNQTERENSPSSDVDSKHNEIIQSSDSDSNDKEQEQEQEQVQSSDIDSD